MQNFFRCYHGLSVTTPTGKSVSVEEVYRYTLWFVTWGHIGIPATDQPVVAASNPNHFRVILLATARLVSGNESLKLHRR